jgi:PAS domain S-box-containing protein
MANFFLLIADMWVFGGLVLLLHYTTARFGFAPLLLAIGALTVLVQIQSGVYVEPSPGFIMFISSNVLVPVVLMSILVLYISNGAIPCRMTIFGVMGLTLLAFAVLVVYRIHLSLPGGGSLSGQAANALLPPLNPRVTLGSLLGFSADMFAIAVIYQGAKNVLPRIPEAIAVGLALLASLWTDAIIFGIISHLGTSDFLIYLPGDLIGKSLSAFILWPIAAFYLTQVAPKMQGYQGGAGRPTFDVLFGSLQAIKLALVRTEKALEQSEIERRRQDAYFAEISENINEALWLAEPGTYTIFYVNRAYEVLWGLKAESLYADSDLFITSLHIDDKDRVIQGLPERISGSYEVEFRIVRPDGSIRWVRDRVFPIHNETGQVYRIVGITEDITERKQIEKDRMELAVERERVGVLRDFISEFSHDLKTPLTAINLKIYQLARTDDAEKRQKHLDDLTQQTGRMGEMIDNLLTLARLENIGKVSRDNVDINQMLRTICDSLRPQIEAKELELVLDLSQNTPPVAAVADDLSRALANLIDNAVHYTPAGGVIRVATEAEDEGTVIQVSDTGIGIPKDDQPYIFDRFFRASNARTPDMGGTGLGLAIVKKIVEQHQGRIETDSTVGNGTTFSVHLPPVKFSSS